MKIDVYNHIFPKKFFDNYIDKGSGGKDIGKRVANIRTIVDVDARLRALDEFGSYVQVISLPLPPLEIIAGPDRSPQLAAEANDDLAELVRQHDRFIGFVAALPMNNPDAALREMERALDGLGAFGVQVYTNVAGKPLDAPEFREIFAEAARRDVPIWIHPARGADFADYQTETSSQYEIWWTFGWPYETSVAMARLVFSGYLDRFPNLKIITHHMGGMIPYFEGRVGYGWDQLGTRTSDRDYGALLKSMKQRPIEYFRRFYADTALFGAAAATRCGYDFFGVDHVLFASDMPFEPSPGLYARETIRCVEALGLDEAQKTQIYRGNAEKLFKRELSPA
ncbi:MAG TPA: amidohydrolase family protein [Vicinamibacterales bacterium]|nr:amidohydrolase family protein [Vicinamibacterales bacterium]